MKWAKEAESSADLAETLPPPVAVEDFGPLAAEQQLVKVTTQTFIYIVLKYMQLAQGVQLTLAPQETYNSNSKPQSESTASQRVLCARCPTLLYKVYSEVPTTYTWFRLVCRCAASSRLHSGHGLSCRGLELGNALPLPPG